MRLPLGYDNFRELVDNKLDFIDKSLFIKELLDNHGIKVTLILRPRRFGKTLNLSMLRHFFAKEVIGESTEGLFDGLKIMQAGDEYLQHHRQYPVIFITFKDVRSSNFDDATASLAKLMSRVYFEHREVLVSDKLTAHQKELFNAILEERATVSTLTSSLLDLSHYLYLHHGKRSWILIDEYDTPLQAAYLNHYFIEMVELMRELFSAALKTNDYLYRSVITGILRIAKENLFSGLNNLKVYSLLATQYSEHFGFTETEVADILTQSNLAEQSDAVREWYNGYLMGNTVIYNPWSIINYVNDKKLAPYWVNTSDNQLIKKLLINADEELREDLENLMQDKPIRKYIDENLIFSDLTNSQSAPWSLLLMGGYLKVIASEEMPDGLSCELKIPNLEVSRLYQRIIKEWLADSRGIEWYNAFLEHLLAGKLDLFERELREILEEIVSVHDTARKSENFYHGLMLGLTASLRYDKNYELYSNKESGYGRYDYLILCKDKARPALLLEFKKLEAGKNREHIEERLTAVAQEALLQIDTHEYSTQAKRHGSDKIINIAIAFCGREFVMLWR